MNKIIFAILMLGFFAAATPAFAKITDNSFIATVMKLVQEVMPGGEEEFAVPEEEMMDEEYVDPREIQQVLKELKDIKRELNRFIKELRKLVNSAEDINEINNLLLQVSDFEARIRAEENLRDTIQEFRDAQIWDKVQKFRAKVEIPREMKQWNQEIKRMEKLWKQKQIQALNSEFGLNLEIAKVKIEEIKTVLSRVQEYYNSGDLESAMEEFDEIRQDFHPGEMNSVLQRFQDINKRLRTIKDAEIKNKIKEILSEVVSNFNDEEYRIARETMDESFNEITKIIYQASSVGKKKGASKQNVLQMINNAGERVENKVEEKKMKIQEMKEMREMPQVQPIQPARPAQPAQPETPLQPRTANPESNSSPVPQPTQ